MLDSPIYVGSVLTLFGLGWFFNREDKIMKEAEAIFFAEDYGEPPNNPEPYTFDDTPLPDMMLSYDPQAAIRPFFMRSEDYDEVDATLNKLQEDYSLGARLALRDRTYAGDTYVNSYGVLQAPESFYDSSGSLQEDPDIISLSIQGVTLTLGYLQKESRNIAPNAVVKKEILNFGIQEKDEG